MQVYTLEAGASMPATPLYPKRREEKNKQAQENLAPPEEEKKMSMYNGRQKNE